VAKIDKLSIRLIEYFLLIIILLKKYSQWEQSYTHFV